MPQLRLAGDARVRKPAARSVSVTYNSCLSACGFDFGHFLLSQRDSGSPEGILPLRSLCLACSRACLTRGCACAIPYGEGDHGRHRHGPARRDHRPSLARDRAALARVRPKRRPMEGAPHRVIDGILWKLRTDSPWRDLPERYGPWQTCFDRFDRWRRDGTWDRLLAHAQPRTTRSGRSSGR
jgi:transposase